MSTARLELALNTINTKYYDSISFIALGKARRVGFSGSADMFTKAFKSYDANMPSEVLNLIASKRTSAYFLKRFGIKFREDIFYVIRHPELHPDCVIEDASDSHRRILLFSDIESNPSEQEAYTYLENLRPRERASIAAMIIDQYLILNNNDYFFDQTSARLFHYLSRKAEFDDKGKIQPEIEEIVDFIWLAGSSK